MSVVHLDDASIEAVAHRVAELIRGEAVTCGHGLPGQLVDVAEIARRFGISPAYVYEHASELGAIRLGDGPKARLRFDPARVADRLENTPSRSTPSGQRKRSRRRPSQQQLVDLLPIKGSRAR